MRWTYCDRWNGLLEEPIDPIGEAEARRRHDTGELYTAVSEESDKKRVLVEVRLENDYASVRFLDDLGRNENVLTFRKLDDRLFLRKVISYDYGESEERGGYARPIVIESFTYKPDETMRHKIDDIRNKDITVEDYRAINVDVHWEPIPAFGDYASIARWDRDVAADA